MNDRRGDADAREDRELPGKVEHRPSLAPRAGEVTRKLMGERVFKKLTGGGVPDSQAIKSGARDIKYHLGYMTFLLESRRWLAGSDLTLADFAAAAQLSCLDYVSDVPWDRYEAVKTWYATIKSRPAFRSLLADHVSGFRPGAHYADLDF